MDKSLKESILRLRKKGKTYNQIQKELNCSKGTISYHCRKCGLSDHNVFRVPSDEEKREFQRLYDEIGSVKKVARLLKRSDSTVSRYIKLKKRSCQTKEERKASTVKHVISWRKRTKQKLVDYKGGKCENPDCGYNKCVEALEFHHKDPFEKDISIGGSTKSFDKLKIEADKCLLLCANCHREVHAGILDIKKI